MSKLEITHSKYVISHYRYEINHLTPFNGFENKLLRFKTQNFTPQISNYIFQIRTYTYYKRSNQLKKVDRHTTLDILIIGSYWTPVKTHSPTVRLSSDNA